MKYHLFGDSHIFGINHSQIIKNQFKASSAMGLNNSESVSGYRHKFLDIYSRIPKNDKIMMKFGQVDTEFVYYIKLSNKKISFKEFAQDSVNKYFEFITDNLSLQNLVILSIYPPFLNDTHVKTGITGLHFMKHDFKKKLLKKLDTVTIPNIAERIDFNRYYNQLLKQKCDEYKIRYIDLFTILIKKKNKKPLCLNQHLNHHLVNVKYLNKVNKIIDEFINSNNN